MESRVSNAEARISQVEDAVNKLTTDVEKLKASLSTSLEKLNDLENRSRWCNRIVGLLEGKEGLNPVSFLKTWLPKLLKLDFKHGKSK